jgi:hypothetical protein
MQNVHNEFFMYKTRRFIKITHISLQRKIARKIFHKLINFIFLTI